MLWKCFVAWRLGLASFPRRNSLALPPNFHSTSNPFGETRLLAAVQARLCTYRRVDARWPSCYPPSFCGSSPAGGLLPVYKLKKASMLRRYCSKASTQKSR